MPTEKDLAKYVANKMTSDAIVKLGIELGMQRKDMLSIKKECQDPFDQCMTVFDMWKAEGTPPYTWSTLITALRSLSVAEKMIAKRLERAYVH